MLRVVRPIIIPSRVAIAGTEQTAFSQPPCVSPPVGYDGVLTLLCYRLKSVPVFKWNRLDRRTFSIDFVSGVVVDLRVLDFAVLCNYTETEYVVLVSLVIVIGVGVGLRAVFSVCLGVSVLILSTI